jgi:hypothetical protein
MSIDSIRARPVATDRRRSVPWLTVLPFAVVLAYADGFWMVVLRGAVGSIERSQEPFTTWLRESTLLVPVYLFAVLGALTLAMRWFGAELRSAKSVLLTALLVAAAGTVVGVLQLLVSSVYDFRLQSDQLFMTGSMHGSCKATCLDQLQLASIASLTRAGLYVAGFLLITNVLLVGWIVAMRGGRLSVAASRPRETAVLDDRSGSLTTGSFTTDAAVLDGSGGSAQPEGDLPLMARSRVDDVRLLLVAALLCSAHLHVAAIPEHLAGWGATALLLLLLAAAEIAVAALLLQRRGRPVLVAAVLVAVVPLAVWLYGRIAGLPFGPNAGRADAFGLPGIVAAVLAVLTLLAALLLLRRRDSLARHPSASAHVRTLAVLAVISVTCLGLAGTALSWFDTPGTADNPAVSHSHT